MGRRISLGLLLLLSLVVPAASAAAPKAKTPAPQADLSTPRSALHNLLDAVKAGDASLAAQSLDLSFLPKEARASRGPVLARQLALVIDQKVDLTWSEIPATTDAGGADRVVVGQVRASGRAVPIALARISGPEGAVWKVEPTTVEAVPRLYAARTPTWIARHLPSFFTTTHVAGLDAWQWAGLAACLLLAAFFALGVGALLRRIALGLVHRTKVIWDDLLVEATSGPGRLLLGIAVFAAAQAFLGLSVRAQHAVNVTVHSAILVASTWLAIRGAWFLAELMRARMIRIHGEGLAVRGIETQIVVLRRVVNVIVVVIGGALLLLQIPGLRALGTSLLASAGVAGVVFGLAAQRSLGTLFAGIQLSITQPVRIGDVVIVEGEWGTIEEITLTYVVVKIWDLRRLVVPITYFLEKPFQNWTKTGMDILGTVFLYADYRVPVAKVREEVERFVKDRPEWDGKTAGLVVTNVTDRTVEMRALVSAEDSSKAWDLRCAVRERLVTFLQELEDGRYLPRTRTESAVTLSGAPEPPAPEAARQAG